MAQSDTVRIVTDLANKAGYDVAARYAVAFDELHVRLAAHPHSGSPRTALGQNIRIAIVSPFITIYEHDQRSDTLTILRVVHGRREITTALLS